ncbi:uncharacterized protein LOC143581403 [Bidens hawaiensis]|uniref:uncharacterized protein LOC143581403 n=1 Tax=Bidens hawaiensis TaxID=980011 RepID=UPI00404A3646
MANNIRTSVGRVFGGNRGAWPVPPEKGVFPLDHLHLCDLEKKEYISCLKTSGHKSELLTLFKIKLTIKSLIFRNLIAKQDMQELGFWKEDKSEVAKEENINERIKG